MEKKHKTYLGLVGNPNSDGLPTNRNCLYRFLLGHEYDSYVFMLLIIGVL